MYYRNAQASAVIYDVTKASSFEKAKSWVKELQRQANPNIVIALVGNKLDLLGEAEGGDGTQQSQDSTDNDNDDDDDDDAATTTPEEGEGGDQSASTTTARAVPKEEAKAYADESGLLFFETSAKTGQGVVEVFTEIAKKINPQDIQQRTGAAASSSSQAGRTGRNSGAGGAGSIDIAEGQGRRPQDACNC